MRILVTGGTGFTGSHLTRRLLQKGHRVVVLDMQPGLFFDELRALGAEIHLGTVTDRTLVDQVIRDCEVVHHVAAAFRQVNLPNKRYWDVNVEGTRLLLAAALRHGVRKFVNCSTCGVHGHVADPPAGEDAPIAPEDYYQVTKYEAERLIPEFLGKGMKVVTVRPTAIYGPGDPQRFLMLYRMVKTGRFYMFGDGKAHYHPVFIDNLVDGLEQAADSERGEGEVYLIADQNSYSLNDLVTAIAESVGVTLKIRHLPFWPLWTAAAVCELVYWPLPADPPLFRRRADWFRQNRSFSFQKAKDQIQYAPKVGLKEGLARTGKWYRDNGYL